jgi:hypothetical protein
MDDETQTCLDHKQLKLALPLSGRPLVHYPAMRVLAPQRFELQDERERLGLMEPWQTALALAVSRVPR